MNEIYRMPPLAGVLIMVIFTVAMAGVMVSFVYIMADNMAFTPQNYDRFDKTIRQFEGMPEVHNIYYEESTGLLRASYDGAGMVELYIIRGTVPIAYREVFSNPDPGKSIDIRKTITPVNQVDIYIFACYPDGQMFQAHKHVDTRDEAEQGNIIDYWKSVGDRNAQTV